MNYESKEILVCAGAGGIEGEILVYGWGEGKHSKFVHVLYSISATGFSCVINNVYKV